jgi:hypothetical protein
VGTRSSVSSDMAEGLGCYGTRNPVKSEERFRMKFAVAVACFSSSLVYKV